MALINDRQHQLVRLLFILNRLECGDKLTRKHLADECGCSVRTINRDLSFLKDMGVALVYHPVERAYVLESPLPFQTIQFSLLEVVALAMAREALHDQTGSPFAPALKAVFSRLSSRLPAPLQSVFHEAQKVVSFDSVLQRDYSAAPWQELTQAAQRRQTMEMCYHSLGRDDLSFRKIDPYAMIERSGYMLLVGYCHKRHEVREFALDRIRQLRPSNSSFTIQAGFCLTEYLAGTVGGLRGKPTKITVSFDVLMAPYAKGRQWQFPHEFEELADGRLLLRGTVSGEEGIRNELLSWGAGFEVLEPATLREAIFVVGQTIAAKHHPIVPRPKNS